MWNHRYQPIFISALVSALNITCVHCYSWLLLLFPTSGFLLSLALFPATNQFLQFRVSCQMTFSFTHGTNSVCMDIPFSEKDVYLLSVVYLVWLYRKHKWQIRKTIQYWKSAIIFKTSRVQWFSNQKSFPKQTITNMFPWVFWTWL